MTGNTRRRIAMSEPLHPSDPQTHGHSGSTNPEPATTVNRAMELFAVYRRTGELLPLTEAVALLRLSAANTWADYPDRPAVLLGLSLVLQALHERTLDVTALSQAVQV